MIQYRTDKNFEAEQLKELFSSVNWLSANYSERLVKALYNSSTVISAWDGEKLIGLINALDDGELTAYVHYLLVNPEYQKDGIGTRLVEMIKQKYKDYLCIVLTAENPGLVGYYEKLGFDVMHDAFPIIKINHDEWQKDLAGFPSALKCMQNGGLLWKKKI